MKIVLVNLPGYILTPIYLIVFGLLLVVFHPIQMICRNIWGYGAHKKSVDILNFLIIKSLLILGTTLSFRGVEKLPKERPIILISNHQSMFDIPPIIWGFRNHHPKFIAKMELGKGIPSISYNLRHGGSALIYRNKPLQAVREIGKVGRYIENNNYTISIFPEGTRTKDGKMKPFLSAGIDALLKAAPSAVVVPLVIDGNYDLTNKGLYPMSFGVKIRYTVLDPIEPGTLTVEELVMKAENMIRAALEKSIQKI
ncbi:MAG TPA: lysophospholipid acyltransferase family protein [Syntrophales bacterium]|jgi:1-acyl-sn-glycerol-3-phosphate acyltransferase|nr:lysophospholipid acyltransferase family protein [Syntrophales bacterium]HOX93576.1 lysophospholipid acyltransferase family protein [Syntrophales bacterium]HPI56777.1 lysophospholipid acyltransferase family protein [Syntrophales bacterium]HPN25785.1 lysophospholipid acyltransferase family protein [Syntrophales bacterium]HQM28750.1 lysophospholipid acyltransferase family protein [Syntrophales bacterium]